MILNEPRIRPPKQRTNRDKTRPPKNIPPFTWIQKFKVAKTKKDKGQRVGGIPRNTREGGGWAGRWS
jgi:hypothetical protein